MSSENNPVWKDDEDEQIKVNLNKRNHLKKLKKTLNENEITAGEFQSRLREQYKIITTSNTNLYQWANEPTPNSDDATQHTGDLDFLLQSTTIPTTSIQNKILAQSNLLSITPLPQLTKNNNKHSSIVTSVNFHPTIPDICMTTGMDKTWKVFQIGETDNSTKLKHTLNTLDMPILSAKFLTDDEIIITGKRKHYFTYSYTSNKWQRFDGNFATSNNKIKSLEKCFTGEASYAFGDDTGNVFIYDTPTKRFKHDIKIPSSVNSICFDRNNINVYIVGSQSEIYVFDTRKYRECVNKINDSGNFYTNYMEISNDNSYLATGSTNGYVNWYSVDSIKSLPSDCGEVDPVKVFDNWTTNCDYWRFNKESSMLCMSSRWKKNAVRLVNLNTMKVYSNFPSYKENLKYVISYDFSKNGRYFAVGNDEGKGFLYKIE